MKYQIRSFSFLSQCDGTPIRGVCYVPENPVGIFQMVHGMSEHKNRFLHFVQYMAEQGFVTVIHDNRGHGDSVKNSEDIGYCYEGAAKGFVEDIYQITRRIRKEYPGLPLILYGHSMGALGVRAYLKSYDDKVDAVILAGNPSYQNAVPAARVGLRVLEKMKGERYRSGVFQKIVLHEFNKRFRHEKGEYAWLAAKALVGEEYQKDEKCIFTYTLNGFKTLLDLEYIVYKGKGFQSKNLSLPILLMSGMEDPCYLNEKKWNQSIDRLLALGYFDIREIRYDGMRHEIHNEEDNQQVFHDMVEFCSEICKNNAK